MKINWLGSIGVTVILVMTASVAPAQRRGDQNTQGHTQFDEKDRQVTNDWYNQHKANPPAGLRSQDRLSTEQESRLREGAPLDKDLRKRVHPAPEDLRRSLPPPPSQHRYVTIGGHVGLIDNNYQVKAVIHLHDDH